MAYDIKIDDAVVDYVAELAGLSAPERMSILQGVIAELSQDADYFFDTYPISHESLLFRYDYPHPTEQTLFNFEFVVDASAREMGVMRVVYVECTTEPLA